MVNAVNSLINVIKVFQTSWARPIAVDSSLRNKQVAVPLQAWSGPECFRNLRFPDFITTAQDGGKVVSPIAD